MGMAQLGYQLLREKSKSAEPGSSKSPTHHFRMGSCPSPRKIIACLTRLSVLSHYGVLAAGTAHSTVLRAATRRYTRSPSQAAPGSQRIGAIQPVAANLQPGWPPEGGRAGARQPMRVPAPRRLALLESMTFLREGEAGGGRGGRPPQERNHHRFPSKTASLTPHSLGDLNVHRRRPAPISLL